MSESKRKMIKVQIPEVDLDAAGTEKVGTSGGGGSDLSSKRKLLEDLKLDVEIVGEKERLREMQEGLDRGRPAVTQTTQNPMDKLFEEAVIPLVKKNMTGGDTGSNSVMNRALDIAEAAVTKGGGRGASAIDELDKGLDLFVKVKNILKEEKQAGDSVLVTGKGQLSPQQDEIDMLERGINSVERIRKLFPMTPGTGPGEYSAAAIEFQKWKMEYESTQTQRNRAYELAIRKQDKDHDARLAEIGVRKETNELIKNGINRIGGAVAKGLLESGQEEILGASPGPEMIDVICPKCQGLIKVPADLPSGTKVRCPNPLCKAEMIWAEK